MVTDQLGYNGDMRDGVKPGGRIVLILAGLVILIIAGKQLYVQTDHQASFLSPLPEATVRENTGKVLAVSRPKDSFKSKYLPQDITPVNSTDLDSQAIAYLVYDKTSDRILYGRQMDKQLPIASITKIMTALVTLENVLDLDTRIVVPESAMVGESTMGLSQKESVRVEDLLFGELLPSGNDAAETLAYGTFGDRTRFVSTMNQKAQKLGMYDSFFVNPTGLDEETIANSSFSTALDLLVLANYALENEKFKEIVGTKERVVRYTPEKHKAFFLYNRLSLDNAHPAIKGIKPGTSEFAGNTVVSYADDGKQEYIVIILNSIGLRTELVNIYKMLYSNLTK